jgi:hypothetical protein
VRSIKGEALYTPKIARFFGFKGQYLCPIHYLITGHCDLIELESDGGTIAAVISRPFQFAKPP